MDIKEYKQKKEAEMTQVLFSLIDNWEEEIIEFKEAGKNYKYNFNVYAQKNIIKTDSDNHQVSYWIFVED